MQIQEGFELLSRALEAREHMNQRERKDLRKIVDFCVEEGIIIYDSKKEYSSHSKG